MRKSNQGASTKISQVNLKKNSNIFSFHPQSIDNRSNIHVPNEIN